MAYSEKQIEEIFNGIIRHITEGNSLRSALRLDNMPTSHVVYEWMDADKDKRLRYSRAHDDRIEVRFESLAEDYNATPERSKDTGLIDPAWVQLQRLKIHTKEWELSKLNPKKYSDKVQVDSSELEGQQITGMEIINREKKD